MINVDIDTTVILKQQQALEAALSTNPDTERALRKLIRKEILAARKKVVSGIGDKLKSDPRGAAQSVRTVVYKAVLGANINIYRNRRAHGHTAYEPPRNPSKRGGNRRHRNGRTQQIMSYGPLDRGFILKFQNEGTTGRNIEFTSDPHREHIRKGKNGGNTSKYGEHPNTGNRGSIEAKHFFRSNATTAMAQAVSNLSTLIETELQNILNKKK